MTDGEDWFSDCYPALVEGSDLSREQVTTAMGRLIDGEFELWQAAAFLTALRMKGETGEEIAHAAGVLRERMVRLPTDGVPVLDTCGTGGDGSGTFNISTAVALAVAASGVPVVKHGNRSVTSRSGSSDVLRELGLPIDAGTDWAAGCLKRHGFAFCFAPHFHPAMANVAHLRRKLGVRTLFNLLGPLCNPALAEYQLLGVGKMDLLDRFATAAGRLTKRALLVHGTDGLDEVSLSAPTQALLVENGEIERFTWTPDDFGLEPVRTDDLAVDGPAASAAVIRAVFAGEPGNPRRVVLANGAAALFAAGRVGSPGAGVELIAEAIDSGKATRLLAALAGD